MSDGCKPKQKYTQKRRLRKSEKHDRTCQKHIKRKTQKQQQHGTKNSMFKNIIYSHKNKSKQLKVA